MDLTERAERAKQRLAEFVTELNKLTKKYRIVIEGKDVCLSKFPDYYPVLGSDGKPTYIIGRRLKYNFKNLMYEADMETISQEILKTIAMQLVEQKTGATIEELLTLGTTREVADMLEMDYGTVSKWRKRMGISAWGDAVKRGPDMFDAQEESNDPEPDERIVIERSDANDHR